MDEGISLIRREEVEITYYAPSRIHAGSLLPSVTKNKSKFTTYHADIQIGDCNAFERGF